MPKAKPLKHVERTPAPTAENSAAPWLSDRVLNAVAAVLLAIALGALYYRVANAQFQFDDEIAVSTNMSIRQLWPLLGDAKHLGPLRPAAQLPTAGRPLVNYSFALNYAWGKLDPTGYRVVNLALHFAAAMLIMLIVRRTLRADRFGGRFDHAAGPLALVVALLWAVHPLQTEPVAYVTQRTELLMAVCFLATLYSAIRYFSATAPNDRKVWLALSILACAAGMASKEVMVAAPVVVLLYDWTFAGRSLRRIVRDSWPLYAGLFATWALLLYLNIGLPRSESTGFRPDISPWTWWATQSQVFWMYLKLTVWPWPLVIHYELPYLDTWRTALPWVLPTLLLLGATLVLLWRRHPAGFALASVMVLLAPTSIVPILTEVAAERRMYLPLVALIALAVTGGIVAVQTLLARRAANRAVDDRRPLAVVCFAALVLALIGGLVSARRLNAYANVISLWEDAYAHQPQNYVVNYNLAGCLFMAHRRDEALAMLERTVKTWPQSWKAHLLMGQTLLEMKRYDDAKTAFEQTFNLKTDSIGAIIGLGIVYSDTGEYPKAIKLFEVASQIDPDDVRPHFLWGLALSRAGNLQGAVKHYEMAMKIDADHPELRNNFGVALAKLERTREAEDNFRRALELSPDYADAHGNLARLQAQAGNYHAATQHFEEVLRLEPDDFETHAKLADAYIRSNQPAKAIAVAEKAVKLAESAGQTQAAEQIQSWLRQVRGQQPDSSAPTAPNDSPSPPALPKPDSSAN